MSGSLPRGTCPSCGRDVALRVDGKTREHRPLDTVGRVSVILCPGSGKPALERGPKVAA